LQRLRCFSDTENLGENKKKKRGSNLATLIGSKAGLMEPGRFKPGFFIFFSITDSKACLWTKKYIYNQGKKKKKGHSIFF
jgi:hypothetical protein